MLLKHVILRAAAPWLDRGGGPDADSRQGGRLACPVVPLLIVSYGINVVPYSGGIVPRSGEAMSRRR